ncbi:fumarylacetoacetate hydrolase family protein [Micromonospora sp. KC207]|uniref:fumarylacetoacetate hydrolase family protein n=1 Tax=Micromonospora sp. KC207 TaxID=2530377 RepID=UPI001A9FBBBE
MPARPYARGHHRRRDRSERLVTPDELERWRTDTAYDLAMTARINDKQIGADRWSSMAFSFADMIAYAFRGTKVRPGDVLGSGNCGGGCLAELWGRHGLDATRPCNRATSSPSPSSRSAPSPPTSPKASSASRSPPPVAADRARRRTAATGTSGP